MPSDQTPKPPSSLLPVASGHSSFSSSSSPPSSAQIDSHSHILPHGWSCKVDSKTNKYYFVKETDSSLIPASTETSSTTSSPSPGYGKHQYQFSSARIRASEYAVERITKIFPEVDEEHIVYLLRIYHNKEDVVVRALLGEGCRVEGMATIDEALFYKLRNNFPLVNPETIRLILAKHNNIEHEAIMAILYVQSSKGSRFTPMASAASQIKLRYLKVLFPDVEENKLFDLLYNNDHDALRVIKDLEHMGYKKVDVIGQSRGKRDVVIDEHPLEKKPVRPTSIRLHFPVAVSEKEKIIAKLKEQFPSVSDALIELALECSAFDQEKASIFLNAMTPEDSDEYFKKAFTEVIPTTRLMPCISTQTKAFIETIPDVPLTVDIITRACETQDKSTWTKEDDVIRKAEKQPLAHGPDPSQRTGPQITRVARVIPAGPEVRRTVLISRIGPDSGLRAGPAGIRMGADPSLRRGPDTSLRIVKQRPHSDDDDSD